jgi:hypothetical protein
MVLCNLLKSRTFYNPAYIAVLSLQFLIKDEDASVIEGQEAVEQNFRQYENKILVKQLNESSFNMSTLKKLTSTFQSNALLKLLKFFAQCYIIFACLKDR